MVRLGKTITQIYKQYILALQPSHKISNDFDKPVLYIFHPWEVEKKEKNKNKKPKRNVRENK
jgi:hypothetical protein